MIVPALSHDELLGDIRQANTADDGLRLWWLGQSGFLVQWKKKHLLFDPYLSDSLTKKYATTDKPHVRMTELVIDPARLDFIDVVTSSHNHTDHLDGETLVSLLQVNPDAKLVVPAANLQFAAERIESQAPEVLEVSEVYQRLIPIDDGHTIEASSFKISAVPAAHETIERDEQNHCRFLGYIVEFGNWTIYHSGDTMRYEGMANRLRSWKIDIAILPINGRAPERRVAGNLWGREAAQLGKDIFAGIVIPCHYDMFEFNTASPDEFVEECKRISQPFRVLKCGERFTI
ncbi:MAG: MBL fold metallo-hydrolase [Planctomycetaceae bacterium]|nr:MBL fold metallo-hydrolase [Planctomycetaceae bacterium]